MIGRIYHPYWLWECHKAGMYRTGAGLDREESEKAYATFLADIPRFRAALDRVVTEWPHSCEHWLTNSNINRIAWLGQASMCIETGVPACFRAGFQRLTNAQRLAANRAAQDTLFRWLLAHTSAVGDLLCEA